MFCSRKLFCTLNMNKKFDKKCIKIRNKHFSFMFEYVKLMVFLKKVTFKFLIHLIVIDFKQKVCCNWTVRLNGTYIWDALKSCIKLLIQNYFWFSINVKKVKCNLQFHRPSISKLKHLRDLRYLYMLLIFTKHSTHCSTKFHSDNQ